MCLSVLLKQSQSFTTCVCDRYGPSEAVVDVMHSIYCEAKPIYCDGTKYCIHKHKKVTEIILLLETAACKNRSILLGMNSSTRLKCKP